MIALLVAERNQQEQATQPGQLLREHTVTQKKVWNSARKVLCSRNATHGNRWNDTRIDPLLPECAQKINQIVKSRAALPPRAQ